MRDQIIDIRTVRVGHVIRFELKTKPSEDERSPILLMGIVHADGDGKTVRTFERLEFALSKTSVDYNILTTILDIIPPIDARAPDGSYLYVHEAYDGDSLIAGTELIRRIWRNRDQWTREAEDLHIIRTLHLISFVAR